MSPAAPLLARRAILQALTLWPVAAATAAPAWAQVAAKGAGLVSANVCLVFPETTEGPYYLDPGLVRADITEGRPGVPLDLVLQVVTADCQPIAGARVDVWHCDALGNYSGYARQGSDRVSDTRGETFLRGTQGTGADGVARFATIWPGWYRGRTAHVHLKVFLDSRTALTSQLFFPDAISDQIYREAAPYAARAGERDATNATDRIARAAGAGAYAEVTAQGDRRTATLVVGVRGDA